MSNDDLENSSLGGYLAVGLGLLLACAAVGELFFGAAGAATIPESLASQMADGDAETEGLRNIYGLTPNDVSLLASGLRETEGRAVVAGYPGSNSLNGPLLTRSRNPVELLPKHEEKSVDVAPVGNGWKQLTFPDREERGRRPTLSGADVFVRTKGDKRRPCARQSLEQFECGEAGWTTIKWRRLKINGRERRCIWAHPQKDKEIVVDFGPLSPPPKERRYVVETALDDKVVGEKGAVDVVIRHGETEKNHVHPDRKGWTRQELPANSESKRLTVGISAESVGRRHFCFRVTTQ